MLREAAREFAADVIRPAAPIMILQVNMHGMYLLKRGRLVS